MKYSLNGEEFRKILGEKFQKVESENHKRFIEENNYKSKISPFTSEEIVVLTELQSGELAPENAPKEVLDKFKALEDESTNLIKAIEAGELNISYFTREEFISLVTFTEEEINKILENGKETESIPES